MNKKQYLIAGFFLLACLLAKAQTQTQAPAYLKGSEVQAYNQHALEVTLLAKTAVGEEMARMTLNGHIKDEAKRAAIRALLTERETREATYQFIYPEDEVARYQARQQVSNDYKTTLIRDLFLAGEIVGSYNCRMVMRNKDTLWLTTAQQASITETAVELDQLLEKDPKMDSRGYELAAFRKIMSFQESVEAGFVPSMYMLALCYRNGYGVERSNGDAGYWIAQAAKDGYTPAVEEYYAEGPENAPVRITLRSASVVLY
jgi:TPR repeat protein